MQVTKNTLATNAGPAEWFTGVVFIDTVAAPSPGSRLSASMVHFTPGARTAWHTHPNGHHLGDRRRRALPAARRAGRGHPPRRPRVLRAGRGALARRGARPL